jgi:hypothetical protein
MLDGLCDLIQYGMHWQSQPFQSGKYSTVFLARQAAQDLVGDGRLVIAVGGL